MEINLNLIIFLIIVFTIVLALCIKFRWDFLTSVTLSFMQEVEVEYNQKGGGKEKLQKTIDLIQEHFKILKLIPDKWIIKFCEHVFKKFKDRISLISISQKSNVEKITKELSNQLNNFDSNAFDVPVPTNNITDTTEPVKTDYTGYTEIKLESDLKGDTKATLGAGIRW